VHGAQGDDRQARQPAREERLPVDEGAGQAPRSRWSSSEEFVEASASVALAATPSIGW
jgi:hypothetical protein